MTAATTAATSYREAPEHFPHCTLVISFCFYCTSFIS